MRIRLHGDGSHHAPGNHKSNHGGRGRRVRRARRRGPTCYIRGAFTHLGSQIGEAGPQSYEWHAGETLPLKPPERAMEAF